MKNDFLERIDYHYPHLTKTHKKIADYLRTRFRSSVFSSLAVLSREIGVSEPSLIRFARALGYDGFAEMQSQIQEQISRGMLTTLERFHRFERPRKGGEMFDSLIQESCDLLGELRDLIDTKQVRSCTEELKKAESVFIAGFESSAGIAEYASYYLSRSGLPVRLLNERSGDLYPLLREVGPSSHLLVLMLPRYPRQLIDCVRLSKSRGALLTVIADAPNYPMQDLADYQFFLNRERRQGMNLENHLAMLALLQMIIQDIGIQEPDCTRRSLTDLEVYNQSFRLYSSDDCGSEQ